MIAEDRFEAIGGPVVVALSGGPDSAAVAFLAKSAAVGVRCIHIDHGLPASPLMRRAAGQIAAVLDLQLEIVEVEPVGSTEVALRDARYEALLARLDVAETLVTGHSSDDQAETVLMHLIRGSGPRGLAGIPARRGRIVRPVLDMTAAELRAVATGRGLPFVDDPENVSTDHLRNRVRSELIPLLEGSYQPEIRTTLSRTARTMADLAGVLESVVGRVPLERSRLGIRAPLGRLAAVDEVVRRQVFRLMLTAVRPPAPPSEEEVLRVEATFSGAGASEFAATDARCFTVGAWLVIGLDEAPSHADAPAVELHDGMRWAGLRFRYEQDPSNEVRLSRWRFVTRRGGLRVRGARREDVVAMKGGSKSAVESIRERGFPPIGHPVVVDDDDRIVWIPGVRHAWAPPPEEPPSEIGYLVIVVDQDSPWAPFEH